MTVITSLASAVHWTALIKHLHRPCRIHTTNRHNDAMTSLIHFMTTTALKPGNTKFYTQYGSINRTKTSVNYGKKRTIQLTSFLQTFHIVIQLQTTCQVVLILIIIIIFTTYTLIAGGDGGGGNSWTPLPSTSSCANKQYTEANYCTRQKQHFKKPAWMMTLLIPALNVKCNEYWHRSMCRTNVEYSQPSSTIIQQ